VFKYAIVFGKGKMFFSNYIRAPSAQRIEKMENSMKAWSVSDLLLGYKHAPQYPIARIIIGIFLTLGLIFAMSHVAVSLELHD
jgi:hypothetical protein